MKIVHSFWSKPSFKASEHVKDDRIIGGWLDQPHFLMSWALSCLRSKTFYSDVELVTDQVGKRLLIDTLQLPYTKVHVALDKLEAYHQDLWAIGKIYTYALQNEPFLHIDSDVFIWEKFDERISSAALVAQNLEYDLKFYKTSLAQIEPLFKLPAVMQLDRAKKNTVIAANAGVIGGNNLDFFKYFSATAFDFLDQNEELLSQINVGLFNTVLEQYLYYLLAQEQGISITCYFEAMNTGNYAHLLDFFGIPTRTKYIHLIGSTNKKSPALLREMTTWLRLEHPQYYYHIQSLIKRQII